MDVQVAKTKCSEVKILYKADCNQRETLSVVDSHRSDIHCQVNTILDFQQRDLQWVQTNF